MAPHALPLPLPDLNTLVATVAENLLPRADEIGPELVSRSPRPGTIKPSNLSAGILTVFCLLATFLALLVWWFFHIKGGFLWHENDWSDYTSSVLRRPEAISEDAITIFTDGSVRRGGGGSTAGARTVVLDAVWEDPQKLERAERMTTISKGGRDIWGEFKARMGFGLRGGEAPFDMMGGGGRSEAGGTSVTSRSYIGRHVPGRLPGVCEVHHIGLEDLGRAKVKAEQRQREKLRIREQERQERLMAQQLGIPLDPKTGRRKGAKKKVRRDWDNRSLETTTTLAVPTMPATAAGGRRKDYEYEAYVQEMPARPKGWKPGDSEVPEVVGYDPRVYIKPKHLNHHLSTRTTRTEMSYVPGDDPGDVPPPIRMKPKRHYQAPPPERRSTKKDKERSRLESKEVKGDKRHMSRSKSKSKSYDTKETAPPRHHSSRRRQVSEKTESTEYTTETDSEDYTSSSSEDYTTTDSEDYTTDSDSNDAGPTAPGKKDLGTKVYHHPLPKRDVWNTVIGGGSSSGGAPSSSAGASSRNSGTTASQVHPRGNADSPGSMGGIRAIPGGPGISSTAPGSRGSTGYMGAGNAMAFGYRRQQG